MFRNRSVRVLFGALMLLALCVPAGMSVQAAPVAARKAPDCLPVKRIQQWRNLDQLGQWGFRPQVLGEQSSITFQRERNSQYMSLNLAADPTNNAYVASRITEIDTTQPIAEREKCWQPTPQRDVVVEYEVRFQQPVAPMGLTENIILWNAPLPSVENPNETPGTFTAFGVSRNQGAYVAVAAQDLDFATFSGLYELRPIPAWLNAADWHRVRVVLSTDRVRIAVAQGTRPLTTVLDVVLPRQPEPLGFQFSVDNEVFPGVFVPVTTPDRLDVRFLHMSAIPRGFALN